MRTCFLDQENIENTQIIIIILELNNLLVAILQNPKGLHPDDGRIPTVNLWRGATILVNHGGKFLLHHVICLTCMLIERIVICTKLDSCRGFGWYPSRRCPSVWPGKCALVQTMATRQKSLNPKWRQSSCFFPKTIHFPHATMICNGLSRQEHRAFVGGACRIVSHLHSNWSWLGYFKKQKWGVERRKWFCFTVSRSSVSNLG